MFGNGHMAAVHCPATIQFLTLLEGSDIIQQIFMRKLIHLKFFSLILLVVMLTATINVVHESAHAMQGHVTAASDQVSPSDISTSHPSPCSPLEHHKDYDGCDSCINCACHAPLTIQQFQLGYNPIIIHLSTYDPFKHVPEVCLSKFIPPQNLV